MPYTLRETTSGRLLACMQVNGYQLPYYGIVLWEESPDEAAVQAALSSADNAVTDRNEWQPCELTEHLAKMANVKLRNDPRRQVYWNDSVLNAVSTENK